MVSLPSQYGRSIGNNGRGHCDQLYSQSFPSGSLVEGLGSSRWQRRAALQGHLSYRGWPPSSSLPPGAQHHEVAAEEGCQPHVEDEHDGVRHAIQARVLRRHAPQDLAFIPGNQLKVAGDGVVDQLEEGYQCQRAPLLRQSTLHCIECCGYVCQGNEPQGVDEDVIDGQDRVVKEHLWMKNVLMQREQQSSNVQRHQDPNT
mmetsp:Transcript_73421/g.215306  ORF Transcript_73421/g.215306 Transcript_73421/m.215306 type:complete len:201 (+) Transcript_73421:787-1389(+)